MRKPKKPFLSGKKKKKKPIANVNIYLHAFACYSDERKNTSRNEELENCANAIIHRTTVP